MHELSLVNSILDIVFEYDRTHDFQRVNSLRLSFGRLSCVDAGSLKFAFDIQARGTKANGAELHFDILPIVVYCLACERESTIDKYPLPCPQCGSDGPVVTGGTESLKLLEMDVD